MKCTFDKFQRVSLSDILSFFENTRANRKRTEWQASVVLEAKELSTNIYISAMNLKDEGNDLLHIKKLKQEINLCINEELQNHLILIEDINKHKKQLKATKH